MQSKSKINLSIIIVTWNTCITTRDCLYALKKYLKSLIKYEIILVDNASTDNSYQTFSSLPGITYIRNHTNLGFSKANNIGFKHSSGEYVLFLNSDMKIIDNSIIDMLKFITDNPKIGAIGPRLLNPNLSPQPSVFPDQSLTNAIKEFWLNQPSFSKYTPLGNIPLTVSNISGGALLLSHNNFIKVGLWNEKYFFYFEDLDLCRRLRQLDLKIYYFPKCQIIHYHGLSGKNISSTSNQWRRLIPSSKIYHGTLKHYLINSVIFVSQKIKKILGLSKLNNG